MAERKHIQKERCIGKRKTVRGHRRRVCPCLPWKQQVEGGAKGVQTIGETGASYHMVFDSNYTH